MPSDIEFPGEQGACVFLLGETKVLCGSRSCGLLCVCITTCLLLHWCSCQKGCPADVFNVFGNGSNGFRLNQVHSLFWHSSKCAQWPLSRADWVEQERPPCIRGRQGCHTALEQASVQRTQSELLGTWTLLSARPWVFCRDEQQCFILTVFLMSLGLCV